MFELENDCMPTMNVKLIKVIFSQKMKERRFEFEEKELKMYFYVKKSPHLYDY